MRYATMTDELHVSFSGICYDRADWAVMVDESHVVCIESVRILRITTFTGSHDRVVFFQFESTALASIVLISDTVTGVTP